MVKLDVTPGRDLMATGMALAPLAMPVIKAAISSATKSCARRRTVDTSKETRDEDGGEPSPILKRESISPIITHEEVRGSLQPQQDNGDDNAPSTPTAVTYHQIHNSDSPIAVPEHESTPIVTAGQFTERYLQSINQHQIEQKQELDSHKLLQQQGNL